MIYLGAVRLGKPEKVVFVSTDGAADNCFKAWGYTRDLLQPLLAADPLYLPIFRRAQAAARQWELVEEPNYDPDGSVNTPLEWMKGLAAQHLWMAFDTETRQPNTLLAEQLLASELGEIVESVQVSQSVHPKDLKWMFPGVLHTDYIDKDWSDERQIREFFEQDTEYHAVTQSGQFKTLVSRMAVLNTIVKTMMQRK